MEQQMPPGGGDKLILHKTIYAKRKGLSKSQLSEILRLEAVTHLNNNKDLVFIKIGDPKINQDQSRTFTLYFDYKIKYANAK